VRSAAIRFAHTVFALLANPAYLAGMRLEASAVGAALPLARFPLVRTSSFDEATKLQSSINSRIRSAPVGPGLFHWHANRVTVDGLAIVASDYGAGSWGHTDNVEQYSLLVPLRGKSQTVQANITTRLLASHLGCLLSPSLSARTALEPDYRGLQVSIPAARVRESLQALTGCASRSGPRFLPEVALDGGLRVIRILALLVDELERGRPELGSSLVAAHLTNAFVAALVSDLAHDQSASLHTAIRPAEPQYIRLVEEYLRAHLTKPIGLDTLAAIGGVSVRSIHAGFKAYRGYSPLQFLREQRYHLAHRLLIANPHSTVASIAMQCGFEHLGRFSVGYRARFGKTPTQTQFYANK